MDYLDKITDIEELTKLISVDRVTDNVLDLVYQKCQELRTLLENYSIE